jgi:hypothetical protein
MSEVALRVFLPRNVIQESYSSNLSVGLLATVSELVGNLKAIL